MFSYTGIAGGLLPGKLKTGANSATSPAFAQFSIPLFHTKLSGVNVPCCLISISFSVSVKCSYDGTSPEHLAPRA